MRESGKRRVTGEISAVVALDDLHPDDEVGVRQCVETDVVDHGSGRQVEGGEIVHVVVRLAIERHGGGIPAVEGGRLRLE
jgi:hypothetical protein